MISIKKYLDQDGSERPAEAPAPATDPLSATLEAYRNSLLSMGDNAARTCAAFGAELQQNLSALTDGLASAVTPASVTKVSEEASGHLQKWGDRGVDYLNKKTAEIKELLIVLARTAASVGERDHQYADHFNQLTTRLRTISTLEDLTQVRATLVKQASELKTYVDQMEKDSDRLVKSLKTEVSNYEERLKKVEELALRDPLTGLSNRRNLEERIETRIKRGEKFCVVMLDVNRLKVINDEHGHLAGDNLLKQFAQELRSATRSSDAVGRWGGDEFVLVLDSDEAAAKVQIERLQKWVFGQYTIRPGKGSAEVKVQADAAVGLAQWQPGDTLSTVVERADAAMYHHKKKARSAAAK